METLGMRMLGLIVFCALVVPALSAQVGHPPGSSPYRDIRKGHTFTVTGGKFSGVGGRFGIGPHDAWVFGVRYDIRTASAIQLGLGIARGNPKRFIVNPAAAVANRRSGPVRHAVTFAEINLQLNVTGGKSWHRIAPYVAAAGGIALPSGTPADPSGYKFGRKLYLAPTAGLRFFVSDRLHLRLEGRATFWKLNYPATFQQEPTDEPGAPPVIAPGDNLSEWTTSWWLQFGLGYSFSP